MPLRTAPLPRMAGHLSFMRAPVLGLADLRPGMVAALGVPRDGRQPGAGLTRFGPTALRETSAYFGSHFSANMQAAMDIDQRRVLQGGLRSGGLADLGDLCLEGLDEPAAEAAIGAAAAAVAQRGALPLLLGGDSGLVGAALKGLSAQVGSASPGADLALVQLGACDGVAPSGMPQVRLGRGGLVEASVPTAQTAPKAAAQGALSSDAPSAGPAQGVRDPAGPPPGAAQAASARLRAATQGRRVFVAFDLSVLAAPWHGMHDRAGFDGLGLRELRPLMTALGDLPLAGIALTGLDATRNGLSTVKTGQRLMLTALLDLLYRCLLPTRAAEPA